MAIGLLFRFEAVAACGGPFPDQFRYNGAA